MSDEMDPGSLLMQQWRPVAPFRDRWDDEPVSEVVSLTPYKRARLRAASKRTLQSPPDLPETQNEIT